jgi:hypothetical protein
MDKGEENEREREEDTGLPLKFLGLIFGLLLLPFRFFISNPKALLVFLVVVASVGGTVYLARTNPRLLGIQMQSVEQTREETERLVEEVGEIIVLPAGELPTLATVTNVDEVKDQPFFSNAKNGDKVLIYSLAGKAYLYRPSEKKIIEVGVVNLGQPRENEASDQATSADVEEEVLITPDAD